MDISLDEVEALLAAHDTDQQLLTEARQRIAELEAAIKVAQATKDATDELGGQLTALKERVQHFKTEEEKSKTGNARTHQSAQDKRIAKLEATVAKLTEERDAALKARDEMLKLYVELREERGK